VTVHQNPKIVSLSPNRPASVDVRAALLAAPSSFLDSIGLTVEDVESMGTQRDRVPSIGEGHYAHAYALPNGMVLKVTDDPDDAAAADVVRKANERGEFPVGILHVTAVKKFRTQVYENEREPNELRDIFAIVSEPVMSLKDRIWGAFLMIGQKRRWKGRADGMLVKPFFGYMVRNGIRSIEEFLRAKSDHSSDYTDFAWTLALEAPEVVEIFDEVLEGAHWMAGHGFQVTDIHMGNFGVAAGGRTVLFDFGHGSRLDETVHSAENVELMANGPMKRVVAAFDECFAVLVKEFPDFGKIELVNDEKAGSDNGHGSERQFGYCMDGPTIRIAFAAKTDALPVANIRGLMAHEFGHAIDFRYGGKLGKMLGQRLPGGIERRADAIAKAVFGRTIKYDGKDVQCVACQGVSVRPRRLGA